jgi:hypothetical protein
MGVWFGGISCNEVIGESGEDDFGVCASADEFALWMGRRVLTEAKMSLRLKSFIFQ